MEQHSLIIKVKLTLIDFRNALKKTHLVFFRNQGELTSLVVIAINNAMEKLKQRSTSKITSYNTSHLLLHYLVTSISANNLKELVFFIYSGRDEYHQQICKKSK